MKMQYREWQVQRAVKSLENVSRSNGAFGTAIVRKLSCAKFCAVLDYLGTKVEVDQTTREWRDISLRPAPCPEPS